MGIQLCLQMPWFESVHLILQRTNIERIIVILSVMCIVSKYHIVFCMIVILLILKYLFLVSFKTPEVLLHLCFAALMGTSEIPLGYVQVMCIVILF